MSNLNPDFRVVQLPIYQDGLSAGTAVGLRIALDALTVERVHQDRLAESDRAPGSQSHVVHVYAQACLLDVSKTLAGRFRHV